MFVLAETDLAEFLKEEIPAEQNVQKFKTIPTEIDGFTAGLNGSEVSLRKTLDNDTYGIPPPSRSPSNRKFDFPVK